MSKTIYIMILLLVIGLGCNREVKKQPAANGSPQQSHFSKGQASLNQDNGCENIHCAIRHAGGIKFYLDIPARKNQPQLVVRNTTSYTVKDFQIISATLISENKTSNIGKLLFGDIPPGKEVCQSIEIPHSRLRKNEKFTLTNLSYTFADDLSFSAPSISPADDNSILDTSKKKLK